MAEQQNKENEQSVKKEYWKRVVIVLTIMLCIAAVTVVCVIFMHRENARRVLKEAKLMQLAIRTVGVEYYGLNKSIFSQVSFDGLADGVAEELSDLSGCSGQVYLESWDEVNLYPTHFIYNEDGFVVDYMFEAGKDIWNVYELKHIIVH